MTVVAMARLEEVEEVDDDGMLVGEGGEGEML